MDNNPARTLEFVQRTYKHAVKHFAYLCRKFDLDPLADGVILSHAEAHRRGIASNHGDIDHIWGRNGLSMNKFRQDIAAELKSGGRNPEEPTVINDPKQETARKVTLDILGDVQEIRGFIENGETFVRLTDYSAALGFAASWDGDRRLPVITRAGEDDAPPCYDETPLYAVDGAEITQADDDLRLLKIITHWEARGEDEKGQILVVNVIKNRVAAAGFPNTIHDVVFASGAFTPTTRADFNEAQPNARTIAAVNRALAGEDFSQGATFFHSISGIKAAEAEGRKVWHERAADEGRLVRLFDHGNHRFYREV